MEDELIACGSDRQTKCRRGRSKGFTIRYITLGFEERRKKKGRGLSRYQLLAFSFDGLLGQDYKQHKVKPKLGIALLTCLNDIT